jgi:hypothetical protein
MKYVRFYTLSSNDLWVNPNHVVLVKHNPVRNDASSLLLVTDVDEEAEFWGVQGLPRIVVKRLEEALAADATPE